MTRVGIVLAIAAFVCSAVGACSGGSQAATGARSAEPVIAPGSLSVSARMHDPSEMPALTAAVAAPSVESIALKGCPCVGADHLDRVVALAVDGLADTTSEDGWSRRCARVFASDASMEPYTVSVTIGWMGTLHEYASSPGANPILGVADEAYALANGHQIALRSGELVAVVTHSGAITSATEAWARQVAEALPEFR